MQNINDIRTFSAAYKFVLMLELEVLYYINIVDQSNTSKLQGKYQRLQRRLAKHCPNTLNAFNMEIREKLNDEFVTFTEDYLLSLFNVRKYDIRDIDESSVELI